MITAWFLGLLATWVMALANGLPVFVLGMLMYEVTGFVISPLNSYVTAARGRWSVGRAITLISACFNLGAVLGPWIGGRVGEQAGLRQAYYIAGFMFILSTLVILFIRPQPVESGQVRPGEMPRLLNQRYLAYMGVFFVAVFAMVLPQPFTPTFLQDQRGLTISQIGQLYSITSIGVVALNLLIGQIPSRTGFLLGQLAVGSFALLLWTRSGLPWLRAGLFLLGGFKTARSLGIAQVRQLVQGSRMGMAYGLAETVGASAIVLAPLLAGYLYTREPTWMYPLSAGLILISILISARLSPAPGVAAEETPEIIVPSAD
jgi:DHA1 family tetracycline resistance protein-like MFS transporter